MLQENKFFLKFLLILLEGLLEYIEFLKVVKILRHQKPFWCCNDGKLMKENPDPTLFLTATKICQVTTQKKCDATANFFSRIYMVRSLFDGEIFAVYNPHQDRMSTPRPEVIFIGLSYALLVVNLKIYKDLIFFALITLITPCDGTRARLSLFF